MKYPELLEAIEDDDITLPKIRLMQETLKSRLLARVEAMLDAGSTFREVGEELGMRNNEIIRLKEMER